MGRSLAAFIRREDSNGKVLGVEGNSLDQFRCDWKKEIFTIPWQAECWTCVLIVRWLAKSQELLAPFHPRLLCVSSLSCPLRVPGRNASRRQDGVETQAWTLRRVCTEFSGVELLFLIFLREDEVRSFGAADVSAL